MARLEVEIIGDSRSLERAFARSERSAKGFGRSVENAGRGAVVASIGFRGLGRAVGYASASFLGAAGFVSAAKAGFDEMLAGQAVAADTAAVLKSTGQVAGVSARQVSTLATSLQQLSGYDDEAVASAENLILTFTNIRDVAGKGNDVFTQTIKSTLDLSRRFDQDLSTSALQLGKALQDPVRGVTALRRAGISFTTDQQRLINKLVSTGHFLDAQKIILREVRKETGDAAAAYGKTLPGQLDILQGNLRNMAGELAKTLNPEVKKLTTRFNEWLENPENKKKTIDGFTTATHLLGDAAQYAAGGMGALNTAGYNLGGWIYDATQNVKRFAGFVAQMGGGKNTPLDLLFGGGGGKPMSTAYYVPKPVANVPPPGLTGPARPGRPGAKPPGTTPKPPPPPRGVTAAQRNQWFDAMVGRELVDVQDIQSVKGQIARLKEISAQITARIAVTKDITRKLTLEDQVKSIARDIRTGRQDIAAAATQRAQDAAEAAKERARAAADAARAAAERKATAQQALLNRLQYNVDKTGLTDTLKDDLNALQAQQATIRKIIATQGSTLDLQNDLLTVEKNIKSVNQQIADQRKQRADAAKQAAADAKAAAEQSKLDWAQLAVDQAGLTGTLSDDLTARQKQLAIINKQIGVHGKTLALEQDKVGILSAIKDIRQQQADQAKQAAQAGKDATDQALADTEQTSRNSRKLFKRLNATAFVNQFGANLTRQQKRRLEIGLAMTGPGGTLPAGHSGQFTAGITIHGGVHMHGVQDVPGLENQIAKRAKARPHVRRGARG